MKFIQKRMIIVALIMVSVMLLAGCSSIGKKILDEVEEQIGDVEEVITGEGDGEFSINLPFVEMEGSDGTRVVKGDLEELLIIKASGDIDKYSDDYIQSWSYVSNEKQEKVVEYFKELVKDTVDYYYLGSPAGAVIMGSINEKQITISVEFGEKDPVVEITAMDFSD